MSDEYENPEYEDSDGGHFETSSEEEITYNNSFLNEPPLLYKKGSVVFVTIPDIKKLIQKKCKDVCEVLGLSEDEAIILYQYFRWRKDLIEGEYFEDTENIRKKAGLDPVVVADDPESFTPACGLCFESKPKDEFEALACNHVLCKDCWQDYIEYNVTRPENLFFWKCPTQGCNLIVPHSFNLKYVKKEHSGNYDKKMAIAYADTSKSLRWCPAPDCNFGSEVENVVAKAIECLCGFMYCFRCGLEDHRPCSCDISKEWLKKDQGGGANAKWMLINTKDCPKCKRPIEKNQGCNYMRCRHPGCMQEFCWLCLMDWKTHNDHFKCNKYDNLSKEEKSKMDSEEQVKRGELQKYVFYYERYVNNAQAIENTNKLAKDLKLEQKDIALSLGLTLTQLEFLENACQVLKNSKRTLKWSYAYGFYLENELQRNLYEIIQEKMDMYSSELHVLLEKEYPLSKGNIGDFTKLKEKILSCVYKCKQSSETFLEKMEEFENVILEEEVKNKLEEENESSKSKQRKLRKRKSNNSINSDSNTEGHLKKATRITKS